MSTDIKKAITIGSATIDIIATIADEDIERMTLHNSTSSFLLMEPGRKVDAENIVTHTGGGAINAAVSLSRQGLDVAALVKVGDDLNAEKLLERFEQENISKHLVSIHETELTAVSVMVSAHDHNAAIFTHRGANRFLAQEDISEGCFEGVDLVYITNLSKDSANRFPGIVARAKQAGAFVAINPGILQLTEKTGPLFDSLVNVDLFICNAVEARALVPQLVDRTGWERQSAPVGDTSRPALNISGFELSLEDYANRMHKLGPQYVGITDGANGAYLSNNGELIYQGVMPAKIMGTTGAGDAFASTLAGSLVRGIDQAEALQLAALNAASVVEHVDAQSGLMQQKDLQVASKAVNENKS